MQWTIISFGKHKGKSLPQIIFQDPDWFFHAYESGYFRRSYTQEAHELYRRARSIKVPQRNGQKMKIEYIIHQNGSSKVSKFGTMRLISDGPGLDRLYVSDLIDFYVPRSYARYDKWGYKNFVSALKAIVFGHHVPRMSRQMCEAFFNDGDNFALN